jgi:hypothetical protein
MKKFVVTLLALTLALSSLTVFAANPSPKTDNINDKTKFQINHDSQPYGHALKTVFTTTGKTARLTVGTDFVITKVDNTTVAPGFDITTLAAGNHKITVTGINKYSGEAEFDFVVSKASSQLTVKKAKKSYKASSLKKKKASFKIGAKSKATKISYKVGKKSKKYVKVSKKGKVSVAKGTPKGTYKIRVTTMDKNHKKASKIVNIFVK